MRDQTFENIQLKKEDGFFVSMRFIIFATSLISFSEFKST